MIMTTRIFSVMKNMQKVIYCLVSLILIALGLSSVMDIPEAKADAGSIYSVSHVNDIFISSGEAGVLASSVDGENWVTITRPPGLNRNLTEVSYGNGTYVGVSYGGTIVTSPDAINWAIHASGESVDLKGIAFNEEKFVVVGNYGTILTSNNGVDWNKQVSNVTAHLSAVTYGNDMFVAVGENGLVMTSRDGESWSNSSIPGGGALNDITYGNDMFLVVAGSVWTSIDGEDWTQKRSPGAGRVSYGDGKFMIVVRKDVFSSNDGDNWATYVKDSEESLFDVVYGNGIFVVVGNNNTRFIPDVTARWQNYITGASNPSFDGLTAVAYGKGMYVAVGNYGNLATSPDGASWTWRTALDNSYLHLQDVIYDGEKFVTVGDVGGVLSSVDGIIWTKHTNTLKFKENFKSIAYGNDQYIAAGVNHMVYNSTDLENWTYNSSLSEAFEIYSNFTAANMQLYKIKFIDGNFMAIGSPDIAYISRNGNNWTPFIDNEPGVVYDYLDSIYVDGKYLIVGNLIGNIKRSDGVTFMENIKISTNSIIYGISYSNGNYVAVGYYGLRLTSTNGLDWKPDFVSSWKPDNSNNDRILGIASHNGTFVAVGTGGKISRYINVDLSGLTVTDATISPAFSPDKAIYTASVAHSVSSITISPVAVDTKLSVKVNGVLNSGAPQHINLNVGVNRISVVVMAADNQNSKTYTILVTREAQTPVVVTEPTGTTVIIGDASPTLSAAATTSDGGTLGFQWYSNTTSSDSGGSLISGASSETYSPPTDTVGTKYYYVVVTNTNAVATGTKLATATSRIAEVVVIPTEDTTTPVISTQPSGVTVTEGDTNPTLTILATTSDAGTLSYQWYSNTTDSETGATLISDATSSTYSAPTGSVGTTYYYVEVTNTNAAATGAKSAKATSSRAAVVVTAPVSLVDAVKPAIGTQPAGSTVLKDGSSPTLSVAATTSDAGTVSYQWYSNTTDSETGATLISDATSSTYSAPTGSVGTTYYYVEVTNTNDAATGAKSAKATSTRAAVVVNAPVSLVDAVTPAIGTQPAGSTALKDGVSPALSVVATTSDAGTLSYQWYSNTLDSETGATLITGATSNTYSAPTGSVGTTYYYVEVTNTNDAATGAKSAKATSIRAAVVVNELTYTVSFNTVGGSTITSLTDITEGSLLSEPAAPTKAGYTFEGWYKEAGYTTPWDYKTDTITADTTLFANWKLKSGGTVGGGGSISTPDNSEVISTEGSIVLPVGKSGRVSLENAITISIPANVSDIEMILTIEEILDRDWMESKSEVEMFISPIFEILKNFTGNFNHPITLTFTFDRAALKTNQTPEVFYYDEVKKEWVQVQGGKINGNTITMEVDHLTKFSVMAVSHGEQEAEPEQPTFSDVIGHWAATNINKATQVGIVKGYENGTFKPNNAVTRAEFVVMLMNALNQQDTEATNLTFTDKADIGAWAITGIENAVQSGIINGYSDGTLRPNDKITRTEMALMIAKALSLKVDGIAVTNFADDAEIPSWAKGQVAALQKLAIISGKGQNAFAPNDQATRAEAVTMLSNLMAQESK